MLTKLDETLRHQTADTFDHAYTSDHRFYDRYWFGAYDPEGRMHFVCGMGRYMNMNVLDGFIAIQKPKSGGGVEQYNYRVSRALRLDPDSTKVGPLSIEILEPYERIRLLFERGEFPVDCDLEWTAFLPPSEEKPHFNRVDGRVFQNYHRYTQAGNVSGTIGLGDERFAVQNWWGGRDHSWGVRSQVGGYEPVAGAGTEQMLALAGYVFYWTTFHTDKLGGYIQLQFLGNGRKLFVDGEIGWPESGRIAKVVDGDIEAQMHEGTRIYSHLRTKLKLSDGTQLEIDHTPISGYWSMDGTGYDWGWNDGKGLGFHRGPYVSEHEVFDISHPEKVIRPDGSTHTPSHREAPVRLEVTGDGSPQRGMGHQVFVLAGPCPWLGVKG